MKIIRHMDRLYEKHPNWAFAIAVVAAALAMYVSADWDKAEMSALRLQMMSNVRGST